MPKASPAAAATASSITTACWTKRSTPKAFGVNSPGYKRLWSTERLKAYREKLQELKGNKQVCATTVGMYQSMLLADRSAMDHILDAIRKIRAYSAELAKKA